MIRINLLPVKAFKRREAIRRQVAFYLLSIVFAVVVLGFFWVQATARISDLKDEQATLKKTEQSLRAKVKEVREIKAQRDALAKKIEIIAALDKKRSGPIKILKLLSEKVPKESAWMTSMQSSGNSLKLEGIAVDNESIAKFMSNLEADESVKGVTLIRAQSHGSGGRILKKFSLACQLDLAGPKKAEDTAAAGGKK